MNSVARSKAVSDSANEEVGSLLSGLDVARLEATTRPSGEYPPAACARFTDVAVQLGISFRYDNGDSRRKLMTQATGGGVGWIDYDRDSFPDLLLVQGGGPLSSDRDTNPLDQLFRNLAGRRFENVTPASGIVETGFSQGVAVGDFDNDGFDDVYVTNVGPDTFYRNLGDGTFVDETVSANLINPLWGTSAAWGDLDADGDLDLFVCNYTRYDPDNPVECFGDDGEPGICHPDNVEPVPNQLFVNEGDGMFRPVLAEAGLDQPGSKSLGVVIADLNNDRLADIYVANDTTANHLFINRGGLQFEEAAVPSGCAASGHGMYQASMGVAFGDYNHDSHPDLYLTHFTSDSNTLYQGLGEGTFFDATQEVGLHVPTLQMLAFGTIMGDFDCNGSDDLFVANGHIDDSFQSQGDRFKMPAQLFTWTGAKWADCSGQAGPYFERKLLGRGVASADFDHDGDIDLAVVHQLDEASLLRNDGERGHWLTLRFVGTRSNRQGVGVEVRVTQGDRRFVRQLPGGTSYCAAHEPAVFLGLGDSDEEVAVEVFWPSGVVSSLVTDRIDRELVVIEEGLSE